MLRKYTEDYITHKCNTYYQTPRKRSTDNYKYLILFHSSMSSCRKIKDSLSTCSQNLNDFPQHTEEIIMTQLLTQQTLNIPFLSLASDFGKRSFLSF